jgi:pSer/pThr/pTyr-binding forkhead associated (FHA) protein
VTKARLIGVDRGDKAPSEYRLKEVEITVGSEPGNALVLKHGSVSRRHALIRRQGKRFEIADLQSTNGTFINGQRIQSPTLLEDRAEVRFGAVHFVFLDPRISADRGTRGTTKLRTRVRLGLEAALILFLIGFGITQYLLNGDRLARLLRNLVADSTPTSASPPQTTRAIESKPATRAEQHPRTEVASVVPRVPSVVHESAVGPPWLARLNYYRQLAGLATVNENDALSDGDWKHSRYIVENYGRLIKTGANLGGSIHTEDSEQPWYTPEGFAAAQNSNIYEGCGKFDPISAIDGWVEGPFHRFSAITPNLTSVGFGKYEKGDCWTMGLDLHLGPESSTFIHPIEFPAPNTTSSLTFVDNEWPDPLTACPGYLQPAGLPITLELDPTLDTKLGAHSLLKGTEPVEYCAYDASGYFNPDPFTEDHARKGLKAFGAVVMIPRQPLMPGETYSVSIEAQGKTYKWSFRIASKDERLAGG